MQPAVEVLERAPTSEGDVDSMGHELAFFRCCRFPRRVVASRSRSSYWISSSRFSLDLIVFSMRHPSRARCHRTETADDGCEIGNERFAAGPPSGGADSFHATAPTTESGDLNGPPSPVSNDRSVVFFCFCVALFPPSRFPPPKLITAAADGSRGNQIRSTDNDGCD